MANLIEQSAELGAKKALRDIGFSDDDALLSDVSELRSLLDSWRSAKRTVGKTIVQALTTLFLAALMAGAYFNVFTDKQWSMIGEIALLIKGLDTAFSIVQKGIKRKKDIDAMGGEIFAFLASKDAVEDKIEEVKKHDTDAYIGSPLQEAMQIQAQEDRIAKYMEVLQKEYFRQGKSPQWSKIKQNAIKIQKDRDFRYNMLMKKKRGQVQKNDDFKLALKLIFGLIVLMAALTGLVYLIATK